MSYWNKHHKKWAATISINGKKKSLGFFSDKVKADEIEKTYRENFPKIKPALKVGQIGSGVIKVRNYYRVRFMVNGKYQRHPGAYKTYEEAKQVADFLKSEKIFNVPHGIPTFNPRNTSGHVGVCFHKQIKKWTVRYKGKHVGSFTSLEEAIAARKAAEDEDVRV